MQLTYERFAISAEICGLLLTSYLNAKINGGDIRRLDSTELSAHFSIYDVSRSADLMDLIQHKIGDFVGHHVIAARLHEWSPEDWAGRHTDNLHADCSTLILRLNAGDSRLLINDQRVYEGCGIGYLMDYGTPHEITVGATDRYTLTAWTRPKEGTTK